MKNKFSIAMSLAVVLAMLLTAVVLASDVAESIVDATAPTGSVTLNPGGSGAITINLSITGKQDGTATFQVYKNWTLSGGTFTGSNAETFTVPPRASSDPATTFTRSGTVTVASGQAAGTFTLAVGAFSITNSNATGAKLGAGNSSNYIVTVEIPTPSDTADPTINCTLPATSDWYGSDVSVPCTASDSESGLANAADANFTLTTSVANGIETPTADTNTHQVCDNAGNCVTAGPYTFMVDKKAPTISAAISAGTLGSGGWYTSDVTVRFTCSDLGSGIASGACPADQVLNTEGASVSSTVQTVTDAAGNVSSASNVVTVMIDKTGPSATLSVSAGTAGANGWYISDVTVQTSGSDDVSGLVSCSDDQSQTTETAGTAFNGSCTNGAGLTTNAAPLTVKLDKTGPTASLSASGTQGNNGWYTSDVTITTSGSDTISQPTTCTVAQSQTTDIASATFNGSCTNDAGLTTNATSLTIKRDATPPTSVSFVGGPAAGGSYYFGSVPAVSTCTADGAISGLASCVVSGYGTTVGGHTMTATATDNAGNQAMATQSYTVLAWTLSGFYQPVDMTPTGATSPVWNTVKNGSTVPLKFEVFAGSTELTDTAIVNQPLRATQTSCSGGTTDDIELLSSGATVLRYDTTGGQFIYNWQTPKKLGYCYVVTVSTTDGSSITAYFKLK